MKANKTQNIFSYCQLYERFGIDFIKEINSINKIELKDHEINSLIGFMKLFNKEMSLNSYYFDSFFIDYKIPRIGKQFDLLKITNKYLINIELKSDFNLDKIVNQLNKNIYYLSHIDKDKYFFTYCLENNKIFKLFQDQLIECNVKEVYDVLDSYSSPDESIDHYFDSKTFLISPFNNTEQFLNKQYFLTDHQFQIKNEIIKLLLESNNSKIISIEGEAGTGKSLLVFDLAKELQEKKFKVLIIHVGILNNGHHILKSNNFDILPIKDYQMINNKINHGVNIIIFDESQRIRENQLISLIQLARNYKISLIFSLDPKQKLKDYEIQTKSEEIIAVNSKNNNYTLSKKIRSNDNIIKFCESFFNKNKFNNLESLKIKYCYLDDQKYVFSMILDLIKSGYRYIALTPEKRKLPFNFYNYPGTDKVHEIIGQEFEKVVFVVNENFTYNADGNLTLTGINFDPYYRIDNMLHQIITRAKENIYVIVVKNKEIYLRLTEIVNR